MNDRQHQPGFPPEKPPSTFSFASAPTSREARQLLGERVRIARRAAHLTQQELAGTTSSKSYISAVERGKMTPSLQALHILAERLGVTLSYLMGEEESTPPLEAPEEQTGDEPQAALLREAERLLQQGRYEEALVLFEQAGQPERTSFARELYAHFLAEQGRYQEAYEQMVRTVDEASS